MHNMAVERDSQEAALFGSLRASRFGCPSPLCQASHGTRLLLLLVGGDKSSQSKDIQLAIKLARSFKK
jgi:hypothetical protein